MSEKLEVYKLNLKPREYDVVVDALTQAPMPWLITNPVIQVINNQRLNQIRVHQENLQAEAEKKAKAAAEAEKKLKEMAEKKGGKKK